MQVIFEVSNFFSATFSEKSSLLEQASPSLKRSIELECFTIQEHNFSLHKTAFRDAVALQYGWDPARLPQHCILWYKVFC